ncbi:MAG: ThiF family adenylyltransferase [Acidobacteria bacterium]|nr:ThiF family adenylyltransferase [Acidobacteriota bacterium]
MSAQADGRYSRQVLFKPIGDEGQRRLGAARAAVVGVGATGSVTASILARAGVGALRLIDRDVIDESNLQRQFLYTEDDLRALKPKAIAARDHLRAANSTVALEAVVEDLGPDNAVRLLTGVDLILDGTDNFETRFLMNDVAVRHGIPWIYTACLGAYGVTMTIVPGETACLRCLMETPPDLGSTPTCDTAGVIAPIVAIIASFQAAEALKILSGSSSETSDALLSVDAWTQKVTRVRVPRGGGRRRCAACDGMEFEFLAGRGTRPAAICGRNAVQIMPSTRGALDLAALAARLGAAGQVERSEFMLRFTAPGCQLSIFPDGRAIVAGTSDPAAARALYARYVGA